MFDFFFKYPWAAFQRGTLVWQRGWPVWVLLICILAGAAWLAWSLWRRRAARTLGLRAVALWGFEAATLATLLVMLWQPGLSVSSLKPKQNIVAVVVDDSRSMALAENGTRRIDAARRVLDQELIEGLQRRFQTRLYRLGAGFERIDKSAALTAQQSSTHIADGLKAAVGEAAALPIGAIVLLSDGAENAGGIDLETTAEIRRHAIPVHTMGFGLESMQKDVELVDAVLPPRALAGARLSASVTYRESGFNAQKGALTVREGEKVLARREIELKGDGAAQTESIVFNAGTPGAKPYRLTIETFKDETNPRNNALTRLVAVEGRKPRILYFEGEPRWEFKFIRRAAELDPSLDLVTMLRATQNKIYRQGIANPKELELGFPAEVNELFSFDAIVLGSIEDSAFTPSQLQLLKEFVDRRGGGLLMLGGRGGLSEGGWQHSPLSELLPVTLPDRKGTFQRLPAKAELTAAGRDSLVTRLEDSVEKNTTRWKAMPPVADFQATGNPKPGALVLLEQSPSTGGRLPLLAVQHYGRGRVAVMATGGSWRWRMLQDSKDTTHAIFWQQLLRWLVTDVGGRVVSSTPRPVLSDEKQVTLRAEVRDVNYAPLAGSRVEARILGPGSLTDRVVLSADAAEPGVYSARWTADPAGSYLAEITAYDGEKAVGRDTVTFQREDGTAEDFHTEQNRELLEKLSAQTGGKYFRPDQTKDLLKVVELSEAGITMRETRDLWDMPAALLLLAGLKAAEWLLRRRWGAV